MKRRTIFGLIGALVLVATSLVACVAPAAAPIVVPAPVVNITIPATQGTTPTGLMGNTVESLIQLQMYKSILGDTTTNGGWSGGHGGGGHGGGH